MPFARRTWESPPTDSGDPLFLRHDLNVPVAFCAALAPQPAPSFETRIHRALRAGQLRLQRDYGPREFRARPDVPRHGRHSQFSVFHYIRYSFLPQRRQVC